MMCHVSCMSCESLCLVLESTQKRYRQQLANYLHFQLLLMTFFMKILMCFTFLRCCRLGQVGNLASLTFTHFSDINICRAWLLTLIFQKGGGGENFFHTRMRFVMKVELREKSGKHFQYSCATV